MKNILILATGGTIACADEGGGLRPRFPVEDLLGRIQPALAEQRVTGRNIMNIDSSNMTPSHWLIIARQIIAEFTDYDGFVITHGTDTMAYTAAALTYLLRGLDKPVVLTGAQYSIGDQRTDAIQNLHDSLLIAGEDLAGVFLVFDGRVINGCRAVKTKTHSYDAFESVNYPLIAEIKHHRIQYNALLRPNFSRSTVGKAGPPPLIAALEESLMVVKLFPGLQPKIFDFIRANYRGVIIESYGIGGIASDTLDLAAKVVELIEAGCIVAITTQCLKEGVDLQIYEVGRRLPIDRIIYARDMTTDALVAKMMWAMAMSTDFKEIKQLVETPVQDDLLLVALG